MATNWRYLAVKSADDIRILISWWIIFWCRGGLALKLRLHDGSSRQQPWEVILIDNRLMIPWREWCELLHICFWMNLSVYFVASCCCIVLLVFNCSCVLNPVIGVMCLPVHLFASLSIYLSLYIYYIILYYILYFIFYILYYIMYSIFYIIY